MINRIEKPSIHLAGFFCLLLLAYHLIFRDYFPLPNGRMGHDYILTLGGFLDGFLWFRNNGFISPPWFTPSFCGGQAFFADPQSAFFSIPQFITFAASPIDAIYIAFLLFAAFGFWGMYYFARASLQLNRLPSFLAAVVFMFNGFYAHRMLIGHYGYQAFMLIPIIAQLLLRKPSSDNKQIVTSISSMVLAGLLIAYWFHSGLTTLMIPSALAVFGLACIASIRNRSSLSRSFFLRGAIAATLALCLSAAKLNANLTLMSGFTRDYYPLPGLSNPLDLLNFAFEALFYTSEHVHRTVTPLWQNIQWAAMPHELAYGLTPVPLTLCLIGAGIYALNFKRRTAASPPLPTPHWLPWIMLGLILIAPLALLYYSPTWNSILKQLPIIGSTTSPFRWLIVFIPVVSALTAIACEHLGSLRKPLILLAIVAIPVLVALEGREFYKQQDYDPTAVTNFYQTIKDGRIEPRISRIGDFQEPDNAQLALGISPARCYNPIYGYRLEKLRTEPLIQGPISATTLSGSLNLRNPACQLFPEENRCQPWDAFSADQADMAQAFASYRPFHFEKSKRQVVSEWITAITLLVISTLACAALFLRTRQGMKYAHEQWRKDIKRIAKFLNENLSIQVALLVLTTSIIAFLVTRLTPANGLDEAGYQAIKNIFLSGPEAFWPEPSERAAYLTAITTFYFLAVVMTWIIRKFSSTIPNQHHAPDSIGHLAGNWILIFLILAIITAATEAPFGKSFGFFGYVIFWAVMQSKHIAIILFGTIAAFVLSYTYCSIDFKQSLKWKLLDKAIDTLALIATVWLAAKVSFPPETIGALIDSQDQLHISPLFEPAAIAYLTNRTVGIDMVSQYGGLVEFASPLLWLFDGDPRALFWFAFLALLVSILLQWLTIRRLTANALIAFIGMGGIFYFTAIKYQGTVCFQCTNFRWLWPSIFLWLAALVATSAGGKRQLVPYLLMPVAIYWNPETGLSCTAAWIGWRLIANLLPAAINRIDRNTWLRNTMSLFTASTSFAIGAGIVVLYIYTKSGQILNPELLFGFAKDFYLAGFFMLPMPTFNLWNIYALAAATLLLIGIRYYADNAGKNKDEKQAGFLVFSTLLFALLFSYYQGRSFYGNLLTISYPLWLSLTVWFSMSKLEQTSLIPMVKNDPIRTLILALLCFGTIAIALTDPYGKQITIPFAKQEAMEKQQLHDWIASTAGGREPMFISFSAWRLMLIAGTASSGQTLPLSAILKHDQLSQYLAELGSEKYAIYYDMATDAYFKVEKASWAKDINEAINAKNAFNQASSREFRNNQVWLRLMNPR